MANPAAGFFGKLPSAGDFVQRRLPAGFVDVWDQHFEGAVAQSRAVMGGDWHDAYQTSPVWRFLLSPRVCGDAAWLGVMGPGTDRVGRCFPMVIASALPTDQDACRRALLQGNSWCDAAASLHDATQSDSSVGVDAFDELVTSLPDPMDAVAASVGGLGGIDWNASNHWRLPLAEGVSAGARLERCWQQLSSTAGPWCFWWTTGSGRVPATVLITRGLPHPDAYSGFLDAGQSVLSWQSVGIFESLPAFSPLLAPAPSCGSTSDMSAAVSAKEEAPVPVAAWLPDDLDLLDGIGTAEAITPPDAVSFLRTDSATTEDSAVAEQPIPRVGILRRPDCGLTIVAAQVGKLDSRQQAIATVTKIGHEVLSAATDSGMQLLCSQLLAASPQLHLASEDLIDPVPEDCAVIAAQVAGNQAQLLKIGAATAWHWRVGRLQPLFAMASTSSLGASVGSDDDFNDLLFQRETPALPGLGATARPECAELQCEVSAGDRLLLVATPLLTHLSPETLVRSLALPSCADAQRAVALAAGLGEDSAPWPLAIIEIDA